MTEVMLEENSESVQSPVSCGCGDEVTCATTLDEYDLINDITLAEI